MKRFLSFLLVCLFLCAACAMGASAAAKKAFDPDAIQQCMFLNDTTGITGNGHCGLVLVDKNSYGRLYSYQQSGLRKFPFSPSQLQQFMKDGLPFATSQFQFDRVIAFDITPEEGQRMYDHAENTEFREFNRNASFFTHLIPVGDNCLTVARSILIAGNRKYDFIYPFGLPNSTFYTVQLSLRLASVPYTIHYTEPPISWIHHPEQVLAD